MKARLERIYWQVMASEGVVPARAEGQTLVEYAIVIAVAVLVVLGAIKAFGQAMAALFTRLMQQVTGIG
jgi:Flp pilus assembly pilin Flp